jgi:hypothetical protein
MHFQFKEKLAISGPTFKTTCKGFPMKLQKLTLGLILSLQLALPAQAKDFLMKVLPHAKAPMFELSEASHEMSYYQFVRETLGPVMQEMAPKKRLDNEEELKAGNGISVRLSKNNYKVHINFPNGPVGGRSYGWTKGQIGDWSDAMYLDNLIEVTANNSPEDMRNFYEMIVETLGACDVADLESLEPNTQRVATNFIAIYTAEAYRAMVPDAHKNWDDALFETTLLGAFHGGQSELTKFYMGQFTNISRKQGSGVYAKTRPGALFEEAKEKAAQMRDYWQFSSNPASKQSGINITRVDFEKMGQAITAYETEVAKNKTLNRIYKVVGGDRRNVIKAISKFFSEGQSQDIAQIDGLAKDVAQLMLDIHADAEAITQWIHEGNF